MTDKYGSEPGETPEREPDKPLTDTDRLRQVTKIRSSERRDDEREPEPLGNALERRLKNTPPGRQSTPEELAASHARRAKEAAEERRKLALAKWAEVAKQIGVRYTACELPAFQVDDRFPGQREAVEELEAFAREIVERTRQGCGIILSGPPGTGKDHLAVALLRHAAQASLSVGWADGQTLFALMRDRIGSELSEETEIRKYTSPDVLLLSDPMPLAIDDKMTTFQKSILWRIVDRRYRDNKPTWLTCNAADGKELSQRIGPQIVDRLTEGSILINTVGWKSFRRADRRIGFDDKRR